jgi:hypothetical protein
VVKAMNKCPHCIEIFSSYVDYQEHLAFSHYKPIAVEQPTMAQEASKVEQEYIETIEQEQALESPLAFAKTYFSGRTDLKRQLYPGPMPEAEKRLIVAKGELRLGLQHFIGISLLLLIVGLPTSIRAEDVKKDPPPIAGPVGPMGPQGIPGVAGPSGTVNVTHLYGGVELNLGIYSGKKMNVGLFNSTFAAPHDWSNVTGVSLAWSLTKTYEEKRMDELEKKLKELNRISEKFITSTIGESK